MATEAFKIIIVGAGPVGFFAVHCLLKANIDFVILEAHREIAPEVGAGIALAPPQLRTFAQLGILPDIMELATELMVKKNFLPDGYKHMEMDFFQDTRENFGTGANMVHRTSLLKVLYDTLPNEVKAKVFTGKKVTGIETDDQGVTVTCADNSVFHGNLVLGVDGTHSATRKIMRDLALAEHPTRDWDPEQPFRSAYKVGWSSGRSGPFKDGTERTGLWSEVQSKDRAVVGYFGKSNTWVFQFSKLDKPTKERTSFSEKENKAFRESFYDWILDDGLKVGDVLPELSTHGSALVPEGDCKHWRYGRIILGGDAAHTWAPNAGRGLNNGFLDIVTLCNLLHSLLHGSKQTHNENETDDGNSSDVRPKPSRLPTMSELEAVLKEYETTRVEAIKDDSALSGHLIRWQSWANMIYYFIGRYLWSWPALLRYLANTQDAPKMQKWIVLNYVKVDKDPFQGKIPWLHSITKDDTSS